MNEWMTNVRGPESRSSSKQLDTMALTTVGKGEVYQQSNLYLEQHPDSSPRPPRPSASPFAHQALDTRQAFSALTRPGWFLLPQDLCTCCPLPGRLFPLNSTGLFPLIISVSAQLSPPLDTSHPVLKFSFTHSQAQNNCKDLSRNRLTAYGTSGLHCIVNDK